MKLTVKNLKPRNLWVALAMTKKGAGKHTDKKRVAKNSHRTYE